MLELYPPLGFPENGFRVASIGCAVAIARSAKTDDEMLQ
jgi:hypothetical protein